MTRIRCSAEDCIDNDHGVCQAWEMTRDENSCDDYEKEKSGEELTAKQLVQFHKKELSKLKKWNETWGPVTAEKAGAVSNG